MGNKQSSLAAAVTFLQTLSQEVAAGGSLSCARAGPGGCHALPNAEEFVTHRDHLLSPTAMGTAAPAPSQLPLEGKEKLKIVSSRHKLNSLLGETW